MFKNHLKFAFRLFLKDRFYSLLNIAGLTLGITTGIILLLILQYDLGYDKHNEKHERIYRYTNLLEAPGVKFDVALAAPELAPIIQEEIQEVESVTRLYVEDRSLIRIPGISDKEFYEDEILRADSNIFNVFTINTLEGNPETALKGTNKVVLTASTAKKYFDEESGLGKFLMLPDSQIYQITAIIEDLPDNSHINFDMLLSDIPIREELEGYNYSEAFWNPEVHLFILFREGSDPNIFYERFPAIYDKTFRLFGERINGSVEPLLEPLASMHFHSTKEGDFAHGDLKYVYAFLAIGIFIILLACINYMNLSTARAVKRTSEMAIRKVLGYSKMKLFFSILTEALLMALIAMCLSIVFSYYIINASSLGDLLGRNIELNLFQNIHLIVGIPLLTLFVGLFSGFYPAVYIPSVPVVSALKGSKNITFGGGWIRKALISFQFIISLLVIICTVIMGQQIKFLRNVDLGFKKENVLLIELPHQLKDNNFVSTFKNQLLQHSDVLNFSTSNGAPGIYYSTQVLMVESEQGMVQQEFNVINSQHHYLETLGLEIVSGRDYHIENEADYYHSFILNESAVKELGWEGKAIGKAISNFGQQDNPGKVIGVVKDFNYYSLHNKVEPLLIRLNKFPEDIINIRISGNNVPEILETIEGVWKEQADVYPFEYSFLDETFNEQYQEDQTQYTLLQILSYLCIFISLLGLIGLASFTASQKTKEIGIRKVMGASIANILIMFSTGYLKLILIAFVIAVPVSNYIIREWMNNFQYQIDSSIWFFVIPGIGVLMVALLVVAIQSWKAARANPVDALAHE